MYQLIRRYTDALAELVAFKSISTTPEFKNDVQTCAERVSEMFVNNGFRREIVEGYGNPIVLARYDAGAERTILIYGHYDVQPATMKDGWASDPFKLTERDGKWYGRGTNDMKGLLLIQMSAAFDLVRKDELGCNLIFVIEGGEESGNTDMESFLRDYKDELKCDLAMTSDGQGMHIDTSFRGVFNVCIRCETAPNDQHSGIYGGVMANAAELLSALVVKATKLVDGKDSFFENPLYAGYEDPPEELRVPFDIERFKSSTDGQLKWEWPPDEVSLRAFFLPSIEITSLIAGYSGPGYRNAIPKEAFAKLNVRVSPTQSAGECALRLKEWLEDEAFDLMPGADWSVEIPTVEDGVILWKGSPLQQDIREKAEDACGRKLALQPCGASIPVMTFIDRILNVPVVSLSIGNDGANIHGVDENISIECIEQGLNIYDAIFGK